MKKDYSLLLDILILFICILASSCGSSETTAKAKCQMLNSSVVEIVDVDPLLSPGDTIIVRGLGTPYKAVIRVMFFTYPKNPQK